MIHKTNSLTKTKTVSTASQLERYRLLIESIQDYAIYLIDPEGRIASWNPGAKKLKGYDEEEVLGEHFSIFYPPEAKNKPAVELEEAKKYGSFEDEDWRVRKDGTRFWANVVISALYDEDGNLQGFTKITRDLTERKRMEDELQRANNELKRQQQELTVLNQAKDEFISLASHQLRTPATGVKQYLGLVIQGFLGDVPKEQMPILQKAYDSNERQIELVNDLLRVAQVDSGKMSLRRSPTNICDLIKDVVAEQKDSFVKRHQTVGVKTITE